jgi:hypothetical protein
MHTRSALLEDKPRTLILLCFAVISMHLINASLFHLEAPWPQRVAWAVLALVTTSVVGLSFSGLSNRARGLVALAYGLPALSFGIGVHAIHVYVLWFIPEAKHGGGFDLHAAEYEQRVIAFLDRSLLSESPALRSRWCTHVVT